MPYIINPELPQGLTAALPELPEQSQPVDGQIAALWQAVRGELIASATTGGKLWLGGVRLLGLDANRVVLSSPPIAAQEQLEARYGDDIAGRLGEVLGQELQAEFRAGWLATASVGALTGALTSTPCDMRQLRTELRLN